MTFAPDLQRAWSLVSLRMIREEEVSVELIESRPQGFPDPVGRHGIDVMSYPEIWQETCRAEFSFFACQVVRLWDDSAMLEGLAECCFEGDTFRRFSASPLLTTLRGQWPEGEPMARSLCHYQLVLGGGTLLDVLCRKPPKVRFACYPTPPYA